MLRDSGVAQFTPDELIGVPEYPDLRTFAAEQVEGKNWAEFGVAGGASAKTFLNLMPDDGILHLFDSYEGLPEEWWYNDDFNYIGKFAQPHPPKILDVRIVWHNGMFADTLPKADMGVLDFVHIDCDIYSSAKTVFEHIEMREGAILLFDEYWGYADYENHERKAFMESGYAIKWLGKCRSQAVGRIL
jgi:predicted O-methyltransferase YrrM